MILWAREPEVVQQIQTSAENRVFLPGVQLPKSIAATGDVAVAAQADALLVVVPAQHLRASLKLIGTHTARGTPLALCAKGIERASGKLLTEILREEIPECEPAILSGPSFAKDVARGLPTAVTIAARMRDRTAPSGGTRACHLPSLCERRYHRRRARRRGKERLRHRLRNRRRNGAGRKRARCTARTQLRGADAAGPGARRANPKR